METTRNNDTALKHPILAQRPKIGQRVVVAGAYMTDFVPAADGRGSIANYTGELAGTAVFTSTSSAAIAYAPLDDTAAGVSWEQY